MSKVALQGNSSGAGTITIQSPNTASNRTLLLPDESGTIPVKGNVMEYGPTIAVLNSINHDITGVPSWVKRVTVIFNGASTNGAANPIVQLGTSGGFQITGYQSNSVFIQSGSAGTAVATNGVALVGGAALTTHTGPLTFIKGAGNFWTASGVLFADTSTTDYTEMVAGFVTLSGVLDRIRITTANGTDIYDAGSVSILYEG